jgi:transcriptional regulator with XRE-family HTH domain
MAQPNAALDRTQPMLGRILREARCRAGVSQSRLAIRTGIAAPSISRIENGHESPSFERFAACLQALGFEPSIELRALAGSQADPVHLAAEARLTPAQRLESLFGWMRFGDRLARAELRPLVDRRGRDYDS